MKHETLRTLRRSLTVATLVTFSASCASFRAGNLGQVTAWPPQAAPQKPSISVVVSGSLLMSGESKDVPQQMIDLWRQRTWAAYQDSGLFSDVRTGFAATDLRAEVRIEDKGDPNMGLAFLSGLTMTLLPAKASDTLTMRTTFKDADGNVLATIEKTETISTWIELFLVFAMPGRFPTGVAKTVLSELTYATLIEARQRNIL